jgi:hypothetical protein
MTGAKPVAATNCLNFGNPEKPEIMAQLSTAIDGIAEACTALGTPITGGNVSLYNETRGEGIYPTPVLGIVGILEDVFKAVPADFQKAGDSILLLWPVPRRRADPNLEVPYNPLDQVQRKLIHWPLRMRKDKIVPEDATETEVSVAANWPLSARRSTRRSFSTACGARRPRWIWTPRPDCTSCWPSWPMRAAHAPLATSPTAASRLPWRRLDSRRVLAQPSSRIPSLLVHPLFGLFAEPASTVWSRRTRPISRT